MWRRTPSSWACPRPCSGRARMGSSGKRQSHSLGSVVEEAGALRHHDDRRSVRRPPTVHRMSVLDGARVVVTGGAGTIGSHIVDAAIRAGAREVVALDALVRGVPANLDAALKTGR